MARDRPCGPALSQLKRQARDRKADQISRENDLILKRLQQLKPNYSANRLAKTRRREEKILWLRHTDHTAGHLMKAPHTGRLHNLTASLGSVSVHAQRRPSLTNERTKGLMMLLLLLLLLLLSEEEEEEECGSCVLVSFGVPKRERERGAPERETALCRYSSLSLS